MSTDFQPWTPDQPIGAVTMISRRMAGAIIDERQRPSAVERRALETQNTRMENAEAKLIQLFYDDAISMPALKKEQKKVSDQLAKVTDRLDSYQAGCVDARLRTEGYLALTAHCRRIYEISDDPKKRQINHVLHQDHALRRPPHRNRVHRSHRNDP